MDPKPTPDPGATETSEDAPARKQNEQPGFAENEGLLDRKTRQARTPDDEEMEAVQRGRTA